MTTGRQVLSSRQGEEQRSPPKRDANRADVAACGHCKRRLSNEYYFTCRGCGASYCYIHMARHGPRVCSERRSELRRKSHLGE